MAGLLEEIPPPQVTRVSLRWVGGKKGKVGAEFLGRWQFWWEWTSGYPVKMGAKRMGYSLHKSWRLPL